MPESVPAGTPYAERPMGGPSEQMPESVPAVRPYAERSRGLDGATPPTGTPADGATARPSGADRDRPHRREFTY